MESHRMISPGSAGASARRPPLLGGEGGEPKYGCKCDGTRGGSDPGQAQHAVVKVPVGENVGQAVVIVVLLRVELQELLHTDVGKAERVGPVPLVTGGVYLHEEDRDISNAEGQTQTPP